LRRPILFIAWFGFALSLQLVAYRFSPVWAIGLSLQVILAAYLGIRMKLARIIHERAKRNGEASRKIGHRSDSRPEAYSTVRRGRGARGRPILPKIRRCSRGLMNDAG
jgi:hypothetical protein